MKKLLPYIVIALIAGTLAVIVFRSGGYVVHVEDEPQFDHSKTLHKNLKEFDPSLLADERKAQPLKGLTAQMLTQIVPISTDLTESENKLADTCVKNQPADFQKGHGGFWSGDNQYVRHKHHKYLNNNSIILDVGGNVGEDAAAIFNAYHPKLYIILEPLESHFKRLVKKFEKNKEITVYKIGLAKKNDEFKVKVTGHDGDATSVFQQGGGGTVPLKVINATNFFINIGVGFYDIDLITVNCEGCEYEVLEAITSSSLVKHFKHIQFATHVKLPGLKDPVPRYCKLQNLLARTHRVSYQYKFTWETWTRNDLKE